MPWLRFFFVFTLGLGWGSGAVAAASEHYTYRESVGDSLKTIDWSLEEGDRFLLTYRSEGEIHLTTTDPFLATTEWRYQAGDHTSLTARREEDRIRITGRFEGRFVDSRLEIDSAPWFQATSLSLRRLLPSNQDRLLFWTIRPGTLKAYMLEAVREGDEMITLDGMPEAVVHIRLRLTGVLSSLWKSDYWFRKSDGVLLYFTGPSGPPGKPFITVTYSGVASKTADCIKSDQDTSIKAIP